MTAHFTLTSGRTMSCSTRSLAAAGAARKLGCCGNWQRWWINGMEASNMEDHDEKSGFTTVLDPPSA